MNSTGFISSSFTLNTALDVISVPAYIQYHETLNTALVVISVPAYIHIMKPEIPTLWNSGKVLIYVQLMLAGQFY
jgi:hypothetical protein